MWSTRFGRTPSTATYPRPWLHCPETHLTPVLHVYQQTQRCPAQKQLILSQASMTQLSLLHHMRHIMDLPPLAYLQIMHGYHQHTRCLNGFRQIWAKVEQWLPYIHEVYFDITYKDSWLVRSTTNCKRKNGIILFKRGINSCWLPLWRKSNSSCNTYTRYTLRLLYNFEEIRLCLDLRTQCNTK